MENLQPTVPPGTQEQAIKPGSQPEDLQLSSPQSSVEKYVEVEQEDKDGGHDHAEEDSSFATADKATRPKRDIRPSAKVTENRFLLDKAKLEKVWEKTFAGVTKLKESIYSAELLQTVRSAFNEYEAIYFSLMKFTEHVQTTECLQERKTIEETWLKRKQFVDGVINDCTKRNSKYAESRSVSGGSSASSVSSITARAKARAKAAAAL